MNIRSGMYISLLGIRAAAAGAGPGHNRKGSSEFEKARRAENAELTVEDLDYDPEPDIGYELPGFQLSKSWKGLNLSDGLTDSAHIYWNRKSHRFEDWVLVGDSVQ